MKSGIKFLLFILFLGGAGYFLIQHFSKPVVRLATAVSETAIHAVPGNIKVMPTEWSVRLKTNGTVEKIEAVIGDEVEEGQLLMQLDTSDVEIDMELARTALQVAEKKLQIPRQNELQLDLEKLNLEKLRNSLSLGVASEIDIQRQEKRVSNYEELARLEELGLELAKSQAASHLAKLEKTLERSSLHSPVSGTVTQASFLKGSYALHNSEAFRIQSVDKVIEAKISEEDFSGIQKGLKVQARLYSYGNQIFHGKVIQVLPTADPNTQEYTINLQLDMQDKPLISGMSGEASIIIGEATDAIVIPRRALVGDFIYLLENDRIVLRKVVTGYRGLNKVQIVEGLELGESVIVEDQSILKPGMRVRVHP
jgi:RND family efflux transporter MFP subunit